MRVTTSLIIANFAVFLVEKAFGTPFMHLFALRPDLAILHGWAWQFVSYMFLHANFLHLFFNMFVLFFFGFPLESYLRGKYIWFYLICGLGSAILHIGLTGINPVMLLGASGAIFGVLTAYGILWPRRIVFIWFVPMPALILVILLAVIETMFGIFSAGQIAHFGHLGGIITGAILISFLKKPYSF